MPKFELSPTEAVALNQGLGMLYWHLMGSTPMDAEVRALHRARAARLAAIQAEIESMDDGGELELIEGDRDLIGTALAKSKWHYGGLSRAFPRDGEIARFHEAVINMIARSTD